jgi:hypothetical protein
VIPLKLVGPNVLEARFWAANEALTEARIPSALPTIRE